MPYTKHHHRAGLFSPDNPFNHIPAGHNAYGIRQRDKPGDLRLTVMKIDAIVASMDTLSDGHHPVSENYTHNKP